MSNASPEKPFCGPNPNISIKDESLAFYIGIVLSILTGTLGVAAILAALEVAGLTASSLFAAAAAAGIATFFSIYNSYWARCIYEPEGEGACSAGIIDEVVPSFSSAVEYIFPFTAMHNRVDVVIKSKYWPLVSGASFIKCNAIKSPIIQCYYKTEKVCNAGLGSVIGAAVGAFVGAVLGIEVAAAFLASCALTSVLLFFCILLALIIAALIAAGCTLVGAIAGGWVGMLASGTSPQPSGDTSGGVLQVGDYVTTRGKLTEDPIVSSKRAKVYWFVFMTSQEGHFNGYPPPYSHEVPDDNYKPDACQGRK
jgi:hypothetical protein